MAAVFWASRRCKEQMDAATMRVRIDSDEIWNVDIGIHGMLLWLLRLLLVSLSVRDLATIY